MRLLSDTLAVRLSDDDFSLSGSGAWQSLVEQDVIIFVGLTGVGKTTTLDAVSALGFSFTLLPNRRSLTDDLLIAELQLADGDPVEAVRDRAQRFAYTRRYRDLYAGGMAHALAQLVLKVDPVDPPPRPPPRYLFDGLRGANEVTHAAQIFPRASFIVLTASDFVRVQRLLTRNDEFDQVSAPNPHAAQDNLATGELSRDELPADDLLGEAASLFAPSEQRDLQELVRSGAVDPEELRAKLKIVLTERQNYDSIASIDALNAVAPKRTLVVDTAAHDPQQVGEQIVRFLQ